MKNSDSENNNEKVVFRQRICLSDLKFKNAKKTEVVVGKGVKKEPPVEVEEAGKWISLLGFEQKFWMPDLKTPKIERRPRPAVRFEELPVVIEIRKQIAEAAKNKDA